MNAKCPAIVPGIFFAVDCERRLSLSQVAQRSVSERRAKRADDNRAGTMTQNPEDTQAESPSALIDAKILALNDWRGTTLARLRALIRLADPDIVEAVKWRKPSNMSGVTVWEHAGIICTGEIYKRYVKLTFAKGASLPDPSGLFNASLEGNTRRAIDCPKGHPIDDEAFKALIRAAVSLNLSRTRG